MHSTGISILVVASAITNLSAQTANLNRDRDPVVIIGSSITSLISLPVDEIVAFRYQGSWQQIPVQIDERKFVEYRVVYNTTLLPAGLGTTAYIDPNTYTGLDDNPAFDADDELVIMAKDAGDQAAAQAPLPTGTIMDSGVEITIVDPLDGGRGYLYLFQTDGALSPDAGQDYITYTFNLLAGDYIPDYKIMTGPNPEDSVAISTHYRTHFSDRWIRDELNIYAGGATGMDILDRHKNMFAPGNCVRTENTFSAGEGAFFTNKDGPVRAIRSYMGANSGPLTQREHIFYEQRQEITTFLRVHAISGVMDVYDYSSNAIGMTYYNDLNLAGVPVDGLPDTVVGGPIVWEMVSGAQGTAIISHSRYTDIDPFTYTSYYSDDESPSVTQCTGDIHEYATSGLWIDHSIPNTDPQQIPFNILNVRRTVYYEPPNQNVGTAQLRHSQAQTPLEISPLLYPPAPADFDRDGDVDMDDFDLFKTCGSGPSIPLSPGCEDKDFDDDNDVDQSDFGIFQVCISGQNNAADPHCAD
ncbi:MAG: hypothetical protein JSV03_17010 [Planctomycetota bacterium]|nr:MAG: hypothetical protein JSV03_17010 [Planctomycetota bacterium]